MKENVRLVPFQTQILECKTRPLLGKSTHVMEMPLKAGASQPGGVQPLPSGLHVLHMYTRLKMSSSKVSDMVRNMSDCPIFLKKGIQVVWVVLALPVPLTELSPKMEAILGMKTTWVPMSVTAQQEKLLKMFNLDGLSNWTLQNAAAAKELVLPFHGPSKSNSDTYLHRFWRRCTPCSGTCWMQG